LLFFDEVAGTERGDAAGGKYTIRREDCDEGEPEMRRWNQGDLIVEENWPEANGAADDDSYCQAHGAWQRPGRWHKTQWKSPPPKEGG